MYRSLMFVGLVVASSSLASDQVALEKVLNPLFLSVDRRPEKDAKYTKCIGIYIGKDFGTVYAGVNAIGDRTCPTAADTKFDYADKKKVVADSGKTVSESMPFNEAVLDVKVNYKGKAWSLSAMPFKSTVRVPSMGDPSKEVVDTFCISRVINEDEDGNIMDRMLLACDDCSSLQACFDSQLRTEKPLSIGSGSTDGHALSPSVPHVR